MKAIAIHTRLSQPLQAVFWMLNSGFFFSCLNAEIRYLSDFLHPFEIAFFRSLFGLSFMLPWLIRTGMDGLRTSRLKLYTFRTTLGLISMLCWFTALSLLPLGQAVALSFTAPLFATVGAALFLHETVRGRRWTATIIGFVGVLIIARPEAVGLSLGVVLAIGSSVLNAAVTLIVKRLSRTESSSAIVTYMVLLMTPMSLVPALFVWQWPAWSVWPSLLGARLPHRRCLGRAALRLWPHAVRGSHRLFCLQRDSGPLHLDRLRHHCRRLVLHRAPRGVAQSPGSSASRTEGCGARTTGASAGEHRTLNSCRRASHRIVRRGGDDVPELSSE
jgi:drug/metabolite transporter (DMT)-like permease